ncbi:MAG: hypothetical protein DME59_00345 [Verrucomicrobia bacterium]|nr:MAG: hypothetical protein DME59_00345 [Verrucomicrobiota bacterium]
MFSGKFVRFQTRVSRATQKSPATTAISQVGQRIERNALEGASTGREPKKAEKSSKPMPASHKIPASPKVLFGAAA